MDSPLDGILARMGFEGDVGKKPQEITPEEYRLLKADIVLTNYRRIRFLTPILSGLTLFVVFGDYWGITHSTGQIQEGFKWLRILHSSYLVLLIVIAFLDRRLLRRDVISVGRALTITAITLLASAAMCISNAWTDQQVNYQISSYYTLLTGLAAGVLATGRWAALAIVGLQLTFSVGLYFFQPDGNIMFGQVIDSIVMSAIAFLASRMVFAGYVFRFRHERQLEEQVRIRSQQLILNQQMAAIGMNTAQIIHNLKTPLAIIKGNTHLLEKKNPSDPIVPRVAVGVQKLEEIICTILASSAAARSGTEPKRFSIDQIIQNELQFLQTTDSVVKHEVSIQTELSAPHEILGIPSHYSQCISNLIKNAVDAMHESPKKELRIRTYLENNWLRVHIADTGCGIHADNINRIFNPFFTTKPIVPDGSGRPIGTGLGLSYCKQLVDSCHGTIHCNSEPGQGTEFVVSFQIDPSLAASG